MNKRINDEMLVKKAAAGDAQAFAILVQRYQNKIHQRLLRYTFDSQEAWDITQETFIRAFRGLNSFRVDSVFYTWLYRIAINTAKNFFNSQDRRPPSIDIDFEAAASMDHLHHLEENNSPEDQMIGDEVQDALLHAIQSLPESLRQSILLRELEGLSYEEIAVALNIPVGTVRSRIFRARAAVEEYLKPFKD